MGAIKIRHDFLIEMPVGPDHQSGGTDVIGMRSNEVAFHLFTNQVRTGLAIESQQSGVEAVQLFAGNVIQQSSVSDRRHDPAILFLKQDLHGAAIDAAAVDGHHYTVGRCVDGGNKKLGILPDGTVIEEPNEIAFRKTPHVAFGMVQHVLPRSPLTETSKRRRLAFESAEATERFGQRTGMKSRRHQSADGFSVTSHDHGLQSFDSIAGIEAPVLLQFPDQKPKHARQQKQGRADQ